MRGDILEVNEPQVGVAGDGIADGRNRGDAAAGENIPLDEIRRSFVALERLVGNGYGLKGCLLYTSDAADEDCLV